ncbi:MAG: sulfurtransferase TusA family protein [candidate division NC10 bacterium]|nr:sulfurtransferase TusA family protein [candidate division NC10 bacterium]
MQIPRIFQLSGETNANQRLLAKKILKDLEPGEEITLIVSQEETVKEVQGWAQAQGLVVSSPKKKQQWQWEFTIRRPIEVKATAQVGGTGGRGEGVGEKN